MPRGGAAFALHMLNDVAWPHTRSAAMVTAHTKTSATTARRRSRIDGHLWPNMAYLLFFEAHVISEDNLKLALSACGALCE